MTRPDKAEVQRIVGEYGDLEYAAGEAARQSEVVALQHLADGLRDEVARLSAELDKYAPKVKIGEFIGFGGHSTATATWEPAYTDYDAVFEAFMRTGATWYRDKLDRQPGHRQVAFFKRLHDAGVKIHLTIGSHKEWKPEMRAAFEARLLEVAPFIDVVAGFNEPDKDSATHPNWMRTTIDHQWWLWNFVQAQPTLAHVKVAATPLRDRNPRLARDLATLYAGLEKVIDGETVRAYDLGNLHLYPLGQPMTVEYFEERRDMLPEGIEIVVSEHGYVTGTGDPMDVTEEVQARQLVASVRFFAERGIVCIIYELWDGPSMDREDHRGVVRYPRGDKPAVAALNAVSREEVRLAA